MKRKRQRLKGNSARNENEANSLSTLNDDPPNDTVPSLIVADNRSEGKGKEGRNEGRRRGPKSRAEIPISPPSPRPVVSLALQMTNREHTAGSEITVNTGCGVPLAG